MDPAFTVNWHNEVPNQLAALHHLVGKPARGLEIGCYEGRSTCWFLNRILTHPDARLDAVDPYRYGGEDSESLGEQAVFQKVADLTRAKQLFLTNTAPFGQKLRYYNLTSRDFLAGQDYPAYDFIMVDGQHSALPSLADLLGAWRLLNRGGILLFDDLGWQGYKGCNGDGPRLAYKAFMGCLPVADREIVHHGYIGILKKLFVAQI